MFSMFVLCDAGPVPSSLEANLMGTNVPPTDERCREIQSSLQALSPRIQELEKEYDRLSRCTRRIAPFLGHGLNLAFFNPTTPSARSAGPQLRAMYSELQRLKIFHKEHLRIISFVHRLPVEILTQIFLLCRPIDYDEDELLDERGSILRCSWMMPSVLSQVSRRWRDITLYTPQLWTTFILVHRHCPPYHLVKEWLIRSKDLPLTIFSLSHDLDALRLLLLFSNHLDRWEDVFIEYFPHISIYNDVDRLVQRFEDDPSMDAVSLESIGLHTCVGTLEIWAARIVSSSRKLKTLHTDEDMWLPSHPTVLQDCLTFLEIYNAPVEDVLKLLGVLHVLESLSAQVNCRLQISCEEIVTCSSLKHLRLMPCSRYTNCFPWHILDFISLPNLVDFQMLLDSTFFFVAFPIALEGFFTRSSCRLTHIQMRTAKINRDHSYGLYPVDFSTLLNHQSFKYLKTFEISGGSAGRFYDDRLLKRLTFSSGQANLERCLPSLERLVLDGHSQCTPGLLGSMVSSRAQSQGSLLREMVLDKDNLQKEDREILTDVESSGAVVVWDSLPDEWEGFGVRMVIRRT